MEEKEEYDIDKEEDFYGQDNANRDNSFEKDLKNFSEINIGTIIKNTTIQGTNTFTENIKEMLNDTKIPYPNVDEIPLIKIKDENYFKNGNDILSYIKNLVKFDDNKFNLCRICKKEENKFFCKDCYINICDICSEMCIYYEHTLIELKELLDEAKKNIKNINIIISKNYILPKEKESSEGIEKKNKNYEIMNDFEINNEIGKLKEYTNDIILIEAIIDKNYIN